MAAPTSLKTNSTTLNLPYHPSFASRDADIILQSADGVYYRVHSSVLSTTSGLFRTMFSLPQPSLEHHKTCCPVATSCECDPIPTHETSEVLTILLLLLTGKPLPSAVPEWGDLNFIGRVLGLAELWETPGPLSSIRAAITSPKLLQADPFMVFALASHHDWAEEKSLAAKYCLTLQESALGSERSMELVTTTDLLALLKLRRRRRDEFQSLIESPHGFSAGNTERFMCTYCGVTAIDNSSWVALKTAMIMEMDRRPLGDGIAGGSLGDVRLRVQDEPLGIMSWKEAERCWEARCSKESCNGLNYDKAVTLKQIVRCVEVLSFQL